MKRKNPERKRIMKDNIVLIGFMGCGKSSVGAKLAKQLSFSFYDTDKWIEEREGKSINDIFGLNGEEYFRNLETNTIRKMEKTFHHAVIATGGGLPLRHCNIKILQQLGTVVYLKVSKDTVLQRLKGDTKRPLLQGGSPDEKVECLLSQRESIYQGCCNILVVTDQKSINQIADEIITQYKAIYKN